MNSPGGRSLIHSKRPGDNQRDIANHYLRSLIPGQRQLILDELEGRFQAEQKGMKPVYDEISFMAKLCKLAQADQFQPNLGIKVNESRQREMPLVSVRRNRIPCRRSKRLRRNAKNVCCWVKSES